MATLSAAGVVDDIDRAGLFTRALDMYRRWSKPARRREHLCRRGGGAVWPAQAWIAAREPLDRASSINAAESSLSGATRAAGGWLDAEQYPPPRKGAPSPGYTSGMQKALELYTRAIKLRSG